MIESLELVNFQAHKHSKLDLHKGINVFTGSSTAGKSSLIRAINWVYSNTPRGNNMVSYWNRGKSGDPTEETSACITIDGNAVKRIKSSTRNGYDVLGEELNAIGSSVPDKVSRELNLTDISFQSQHSPHFLLAQSSGEVSTFLNTVLNLSVIDETLTKVSTTVRTSKQREETVNEELEKISGELDSLGYVDSLLPLVDEYSTLSLKTQENLVSINRLKKLLDDTELLCISVNKQQVMVNTIKPMVNSLSCKVQSNKARKESIQSMLQLETGIEACSEKIKELSNLLKVKPIVVEYNDRFAAATLHNKKMASLSNTMYTIKTCRERICNSEDDILTIKSKMPETCPICGGKI